MACYLNIGSNMGDRHALIEQAVALLRKALPHCRMRLSDYIESDPWGYDSPHKFLNLGVAIDGYGADKCRVATCGDRCDAETPEALLRLTQSIERQVADAPHRHPDGSYRDRPIDIDIIAIDGVAVSTPELTLPHPRAAQRPFVLIPLAQLGGSI